MKSCVVLYKIFFSDRCEIYLGVVILVLGLLIQFGGNFARNVVVLSGAIHYIYIFIWRLLVKGSWVGSLTEIGTPVILSCVCALLAYLIPRWRKAWQEEISEEGVV